MTADTGKMPDLLALAIHTEDSREQESAATLLFDVKGELDELTRFDSCTVHDCVKDTSFQVIAVIRHLG